MNRKEVAEIKRRLGPDKSNIEHIYGCYVSSSGSIISYLDESVSLLTNEEKEMYFSVIKKVLGGTVGRNLTTVNFETAEVLSGKEYKLLMSLRDTELKDGSVRDELYRSVISSMHTEENYVIILAFDRYDVPHHGKDGQFDGESEDTFRYYVCCVCPVKDGKAELGYDHDEKRFAFRTAGSTLSAPEIGFMFPTFDDRKTNIYNALFFSKSTKDDYRELTENLFKSQTALPPAGQKNLFNNLICDASEGKIDLEQLKTIHDELHTVIEAHKESKSPDTLTISASQMGTILHNCGFSDEAVNKFESSCDDEIASEGGIIPSNIIETSSFAVATPEISIKVKPEFTGLISTRIINGKKYILISAESGVEVNGVPITIE